MSTKFIIRFDDICSTMAWSKFLEIKSRLEELNVKSILGVVPECRDPKLDVGEHSIDFFDRVRRWQGFGDTIAQHGTFHIYDSCSSGILGINSRSEFAGHDYQLQLDRINYGKQILIEEGVWQPYFMAPAHSFDKNTIKALTQLDFLAITDGYGFYPYRFDSIVMVPQLTSFPLNVGFGYSTICLHTNTISQMGINRLLAFVEKYIDQFVDFKDVVKDCRNAEWGVALDKLITFHCLRVLRYLRRG